MPPELANPVRRELLDIRRAHEVPVVVIDFPADRSAGARLPLGGALSWRTSKLGSGLDMARWARSVGLVRW